MDGSAGSHAAEPQGPQGEVTSFSVCSRTCCVSSCRFKLCSSSDAATEPPPAPPSTSPRASPVAASSTTPRTPSTTAATAAGLSASASSSRERRRCFLPEHVPQRPFAGLGRFLVHARPTCAAFRFLGLRQKTRAVVFLVIAFFGTPHAHAGATRPTPPSQCLSATLPARPGGPPTPGRPA